jgi:adenine-specific DNA-methyltransferase
MEKKNYSKVNLTSSNLSEEKLAELSRILPEAFSENKIDWEKLRAVLGDAIDERIEKFSFTWVGKSNAIKNVLIPSKATLLPLENESVKFDTSENLFIEGDNLEVLKLLQKAYFEEVKMIYIDPPYNSGGDLIYHDNFTAPLKNYLQQTGQIDADGNKLQTNRETNGRYHSDWLSMMYPRLKLAWNLLRNDGVIFVSIDDNEAHNLRQIMNEIFGEENFIAQIIIEGTPKNDPYVVSTSHEYCLVYAKEMEIAKTAGYGLTNKHYSNIQKIWDTYQPNYDEIEKKLKEYYLENNVKNDNIANYKFADEDGVYRIGPIDDPQSSGPKDDRINPKTGKPCKIPGRGWRCTVETWNEWLEDGLIWFPDNDNISPSKKTFIFSERTDVLRSYHKIQTRKDTNYLKNIFGTTIAPFSNPKPRELIYHFIKNCNDKGMTVLDFFAGSGTTAEALLQINKDDEGSRKFILVQLPEEITLTGKKSNKEKKIAQAAIDFLKSIKKPLNVAELAKERIRRFIKSQSIADGFKVFNLAESNYPENQFEFDPEKSEEKTRKHLQTISPRLRKPSFLMKSKLLMWCTKTLSKKAFR